MKPPLKFQQLGQGDLNVSPYASRRSTIGSLIAQGVTKLRDLKGAMDEAAQASGYPDSGMTMGEVREHRNSIQQHTPNEVLGKGLRIDRRK